MFATGVLKCACKPPWREGFLDCNCNFLPILFFKEQTSAEVSCCPVSHRRGAARWRHAGSTPRRRLLQGTELVSLQPVPKFVPPNGPCLGENRTLTSNNSSGGRTRGSHPPLLGADLVFRVQCKGKTGTAAKNPALDPS